MIPSIRPDGQRSPPHSPPGTEGRRSAFAVSLDFELRWGVRDLPSFANYLPNLYGARAAVPALLRLFETYGIHATWAAVGFLFARDKDELRAHFPRELPSYSEAKLSPYQEVERIGPDEARDPLSYAPSLLDRIAQTPGQEIATHTFSHYYCLEPGQTEAQFRADLQAACAIGARYGSVCSSLVLPRNQYNPAYDRALAESGVRGVRVSGRHWAYTPRPGANETRIRRAARLLDAHIPLSGNATVAWPLTGDRDPVLLRASAFLRPVRLVGGPLERLRLRRILHGMSTAAREGQVYHLWWHPHNFGTHLQENLAFLELILRRFSLLQRESGMVTVTMDELTRLGKGVDHRISAVTPDPAVRCAPT